MALYLAACLALGGVLAAALSGRSGVPLPAALAVCLPLAAVFGFVCLSSWFVCLATPLHPHPDAASGTLHTHTSATSTLVANLGGATVFASVVWLFLARFISWAVAHLPGLAVAARLFADQTVLLFVVGALLYLLALSVHYVILGIDAARATERWVLESQLHAREAELKALRAQIEPQFLFNALNSLGALTTTDAQAARRMCLLLGDFLRATLTLGARERITLAEELALTRRFFEIEQVRYGSRLKMEEAIEADAGDCLVPPLLLQPLAENAINHGVAGLIEGGTVRLEARRADGALQIRVDNPFDGDQPGIARRGVGLENVRRRLATHYRGQASMNVTTDGDRFVVTMRLPAFAPADGRGATVRVEG